MFEVNFLIVGTQKGGTTALSTFLAEDPQICMAPSKEVHFFDAPDFQDDWSKQEITDKYRGAFPNFDGQQLIGEATPIYMYLPGVVERIYRYSPKMKLIVLLRDPIARAISHYHMEQKRNVERFPLTLALLLEPIRRRCAKHDVSFDSPIRSYSYVDRGRYSRQVALLRKLFPDGQLLILRTEDLWGRHDQVVARVYEFLGLRLPNNLPQRRRIFHGTYTLNVGWIARLWLWSWLATERKLWRRYEVDPAGQRV